MSLKTTNSDHFTLSLAGRIIKEMEAEAGGDTEAISELSTEETHTSVMEVRALVSRLNAIDPQTDQEGADSLSEIKLPSLGGKFDLNDLIDRDLAEAAVLLENPDLAQKLEHQEIRTRLKELLRNHEVKMKYRELFLTLLKYHRIVKKLLKSYQKGHFISSKSKATGKLTADGSKEIQTIEESELIPEEHKAVIIRQIIRILQSFQRLCREETQNVRNQVSRAGRDYNDSDYKVLAKLEAHFEKCQKELDELQQDRKVPLIIRMDEIDHDRSVLLKMRKKSQNPLANGALKTGYIETTSRCEIIYGRQGPDHSILSSLRAGQNVELLGPTGAGKTKLAETAARVYSNKAPVIVSGGPGVYRSTFFGALRDLGKRTDGAAIKCMKEGRVLIIDEDNRIDPRQIAEIKLILGKKAGDIYIHPDTSEEILIQPGFGVMVTRNEKGKHHRDRYDLPPDYRREFTHGSFEIDYYTPAEMYYRFLLPKLCKADGSIDLSAEEIGGKKDDPSTHSPLLALTIAAEKIQAEYKSYQLKNAVFEAGFLIDLLNDWPEMSQKKKVDGSQVSFLEYLENKLIEFIKRPIGNPDRKKIIEILVTQGFFRGRKTEEFATANEGEVYSEADFRNLFGGTSTVFKPPSNKMLTAQNVAMLDPFDMYEIPPPPPHPLQTEIDAFQDKYNTLCENFDVFPISFTAHSLEEQLPVIVKSIEEMIDSAPQMKNMEIRKKLVRQCAQEGLEHFLANFERMVFKYLQEPQASGRGGSPLPRRAY